ncbi:MAG TPA: MFS transporter [Gaiellaceae bacterium]|jgi:EmrB/QacA subfamily drug resistance transporter
MEAERAYEPSADTKPTGTGSPGLIFAILAVGVVLASLDLFIVNIALPAIEADFGGSSTANISWVLNGYTIVFAALLVPAGKLGDVIGRRRVFVFGLAAFGLGSALCAAAPSLAFLVGARVLQGVGAAAVTPTSLGLLLPVIAPSKRPAAIGGWAALGAVGAAAGPPLGGLLTHVSWHWIFIVNIPLAFGALLAVLRYVPEIRDPAKPPLPDGLGTLLLIASVALATLGLVKGADWSWDGRVIGCFVAAAGLAVAFVYRSSRHPSPVLELSIIRVPAFALATLSSTLFFAAFSVMLIGNVFFLTDAWHYSVLRAGLALTPGPVAAAATAPFAGRLAARIGPGAVGAVGSTLFAASAFMFVEYVGAGHSYATIFLPVMVLGGIGVGFALPAFTIAATRTLAPSLLATGIGAQSMFRQIGGALGVAAFVAILGTPTADTIVARFDDTRWFMAATAIVASAALVLIRRPAPAAVAADAPRGVSLSRETG